MFGLPVAYVAIRDQAQPSGGIIDLEYRAVGEDDFDAARWRAASTQRGHESTGRVAGNAELIVWTSGRLEFKQPSSVVDLLRS
jgi:hypothetical protein